MYSKSQESFWLLYCEWKHWLILNSLVIVIKYFPGAWVTASLLQSAGRFCVFWLISIMLWFEWPQFFLRFLILPVFLSGLFRPFQARKLQIVSPSPSCSTVFLVLWQGPSICLYFRSLLFSLCAPLGRQNPLIRKFSGLNEPFLFQNLR